MLSMRGLIALLRTVSRRLAEASMAALALLTLVDVLGRYVFNVSVVGAVELTEVLMVGVIFSGIVLASLEREHISVDVLPLPFSARGLAVHDGLSRLLAIGISLLLGAVSWTQARSALDFADRTTMLSLPLAPVVFFMSALLFCNAVVLVGQWWLDRRIEPGPTHD